jgi:hypothetical protein
MSKPSPLISAARHASFTNLGDMKGPPAGPGGGEWHAEPVVVEAPLAVGARRLAFPMSGLVVVARDVGDAGLGGVRLGAGRRQRCVVDVRCSGCAMC